MCVPEAILEVPEAILNVTEAILDSPEAILDVPEAILDVPEAILDVTKAILCKNENKANSAQLGGAGAWAELGNKKTLVVDTLLYWMFQRLYCTMPSCLCILK